MNTQLSSQLIGKHANQAKIVENFQQKTENLSIEELKKLISKATEVCVEVQKHEKDEALLSIVEQVKRHNIPFDEIIHLLTESHAIFSNHSVNGKMRKLYVDPNNNENTWLGVGRRPAWIRDLVEQGHDIEEFAAEVADEGSEEFFYYNPEKPTQRWNGLGRKPSWFKQLQEEKVDVEQYKTLY